MFLAKHWGEKYIVSPGGPGGEAKPGIRECKKQSTVRWAHQALQSLPSLQTCLLIGISSKGLILLL